MTQLWSLCRYVHRFITSFQIISPSYTSACCVSMIGNLESWKFMQKLMHIEKNMLKSSSCAMTSSWLNWRKTTLYIIPLHLLHCVLLYHVYHPPKTSPLREVSKKKTLCFIEARYGNVRTRYPPGRPGGSPQVVTCLRFPFFIRENTFKQLTCLLQEIHQDQ